MKQKLSMLVAVVALLWGGLAGYGPAAASPSAGQSSAAEFGRFKHPVIATSLLDEAGVIPADDPLAAATADADVDDAGRVKVEISGLVEAIAAAVNDIGGVVDASVVDRLTAFVPADRLLELAEVNAVTTIREPLPALPAIESQGVIETGAKSWHTAGQTGVGVKIAIVDVGFAGYSTAQASGEVPAPTGSQDWCNNINGDNHGTAVTETVFDMAPGAQIYLICVDNDLDIVSAASFITSNDINIVNASIGNPMWGRGDGSGGPGTVQQLVRTQRAQGILWVVSAGNDGLNHSTVVPSGPDYELFPGEPDSPHLIQLRPGGDYTLGFTVPASCPQAMVLIKWDGWPVTGLDFDVFILDGPDPLTANIVGFGTGEQSGSQRPTEAAGVSNPGGIPRNFYLVVNRFAAPANPRFDLYFQCVSALEFGTAAGSVSEPATSPYVLTAGAHQVNTNVPEPYSSRGPTIDGRVKPDISGPDKTANSVYTSFSGTSAAAPHVAGAAALLKSANGSLDPAELQQILESRAVDIGVAGKDNDNGKGKLALGAAAPAPTPPAGDFFTPLTTPIRLLDTRMPCTGANPKCTPFGPGQQFNLTVAGLNGVPPNATAVVLNVTVAGSTGSGFVTLWPTGGVPPTTSNLNFEPGQIVPNNVTATIGTAGQVSILNSFGTTPIIVDLAGYYAPTGTSGFVPLNPPRRALDTRPAFCVGAHCGALVTAEDIAVKLRDTTFGGTPIPATATAVALNVTVTDPTQSGHIAIYPDGIPRPTVSSLNFRPGLTVANLVIAKVGDNHNVRFFNSFGNTHLIIDIVGYFMPGTGGRYVALNPPARDLDTRFGNGDIRTGVPHPRPIGSGEAYPLQATSLYGVPHDATAAVLNVTAVAPPQSGFIAVYPAGAAFPGTSSLNYTPGKIVPNAVMTSIGTGGQVNVYNSFGQAHVISDIAGYFIG